MLRHSEPGAKAAFAACTARSTSSCPAMGIWSLTMSPVAGLSTEILAGFEEFTYLKGLARWLQREWVMGVYIVVDEQLGEMTVELHFRISVMKNCCTSHQER